MATISTLDKAGATHPSRFANKKVPYVVEFVLDYAKALAAKGSALAASDVIEVINIPAGTIVLDAGAEVLVAADSTTLTLNVGTGADADEWVAGLDGKTLGWAPDLDSSPVINTYPTADTIDVVLATLTGTLTSGEVRVYALLADVSKTPGNPGLATLKS
jgi:hypothetical protein